MIPVTPLEGRTVLLNANLIEAIEETPDTVIILAGGRRMVVVDVPDHLVAKIERIRASVLAAAHNKRPRGRAQLYAIDGEGAGS
jgi:flagellar protein FlbD